MANQAIKHDQDKPRMDLVPAAATLEIAKVFTFGAKKYEDNNWRKGFKYSRLIASLERHIAAFKECEDTDLESGLPHLAHAGCCVLMLLEHTLKDYGEDDRWYDPQPELDDLSKEGPVGAEVIEPPKGLNGPNYPYITKIGKKDAQRLYKGISG